MISRFSSSISNKPENPVSFQGKNDAVKKLIREVNQCFINVGEPQADELKLVTSRSNHINKSVYSFDELLNSYLEHFKGFAKTFGILNDSSKAQNYETQAKTIEKIMKNEKIKNVRVYR